MPIIPLVVILQTMPETLKLNEILQANNWNTSICSTFSCRLLFILDICCSILIEGLVPEQVVKSTQQDQLQCMVEDFAGLMELSGLQVKRNCEAKKNKAVIHINYSAQSGAYLEIHWNPRKSQLGWAKGRESSSQEEREGNSNQEQGRRKQDHKGETREAVAVPVRNGRKYKELWWDLIFYPVVISVQNKDEIAT